MHKEFVEVFNVIVENKDCFIIKCKEWLHSENVLVRYTAVEFIKIIENDKVIKEFNIEIYFPIIEKMIVFEGNKIIVTLLDGTDVECEIK